jgi:hypothetical protein
MVGTRKRREERGEEFGSVGGYQYFFLLVDYINKQKKKINK